MRAETTGASRPVVLRQTGAVLVPVAVWVFCAVAVADAVVEGTTVFAVRATAVMAVIAFATWLVLASPCLAVLDDGLRIVNPLRVYWVPFAALEDVRVRGLTTVTARHRSGRPRAVTSWNAPGLPRVHSAATPPVLEVIEGARASWERRTGDHAGDETGDDTGHDTGQSVMSTSWRWRPVLVLAALVICGFALWLR